MRDSFLSLGLSLSQEQGQSWCGLEKTAKRCTPDGHSVAGRASSLGQDSHGGETDPYAWKGLTFSWASRWKAAERARDVL